MIDPQAKPPLVLVPGIQGRWEWMQPAIDALRRNHHVMTFSLNEQQGPGIFQKWTAHIDGLLDRAGSAPVVLVGVSFGGLVATYYAAERPERVSHLVLVSAPSPRWKLDRRTASYVQRPRLALPLFTWRAIFRLGREVFASLPPADGLRFAVRHVLRVLRWPLSPKQMATWVDEWLATDLLSACRRITAPTLVVTGESHLDEIVPVSSSLEYLNLIPGSRHVTLERTGHIGLLLRPDAFAGIVTDFEQHALHSSRTSRPARSAS